MSQVETKVAAHYDTQDLAQVVRDALAKMGIDASKATAADLKTGDEFHTGGVLATDHLFDKITLAPGAQVLDVGSGIGGTSRYVAERYDANVVGIDLTPGFVEAATALSEMVGLGGKTRFEVASALDMPVADEAFDLAVMMHVGMNIEDKSTLLGQIAAKLKPGGRLALFDVMRGAEASDPVFPLPWSSVPETSFVAAPDVYRDAAAAAGLVLVEEEDRRAFALTFFRESAARMAEHGPPPLGIHLMMGETADQKLGNYNTNVEAGRLGPVEMIFEKPS